MNSLIIKELEPLRLPLLKKLYKSHYPSTKIKAGEKIIVAERDSQIVGVVRYRKLDKWELLTGMLVIPEVRNQGIASQLLHFSQNDILQDNFFCFAYKHLEQLYKAHGFKTIPVEELPSTLAKLYLRYTQTGKPLIVMQYHS
ncbi:acyltransferase [Vibrio inusitatus NBRC 102082]|uniref:Acyltransferase n=1 Tax=Vibrio inusitatus NBRC 102082 TaxID=1219070 RepID=A0A4Y3I0P1_9VIBR|nr:GNAT family N-acetyltransferase [Vibrio inusitatus]GEA53019.1 acyltransferase [Vibrio inusitatus NBRC 102082]